MMSNLHRTYTTADYTDLLLIAAGKLNTLGRPQSAMAVAQHGLEALPLGWSTPDRVVTACAYALPETADRLMAQLVQDYGQAALDDLREPLSGNRLGLLLSLCHAAPAPSGPPVAAIKGRLCYVLADTIVTKSNGYTLRAHHLSQALVAGGCDVHALTMLDADGADGAAQGFHQIRDAVSYHGVAAPKGTASQSPDLLPLLTAADLLEEQFRVIKPEAVIAASNYLNALPALIAARRLGLPFLYEVRGFWELTRRWRSGADAGGGAAFDIDSFMEARIARSSDHVLTLSQSMRDELVRRGVSAHKITVAPNGVTLAPFTPQRDPKKARQGLGILQRRGEKTLPVIAYFGSLTPYEGLDDLVAACGQLRAQGQKFRLVIAGGGHDDAAQSKLCADLHSLAADTGLRDWLLTPGQLDHGDLPDWYAAVDIIALPRKDTPLTRIVPPLKPIEAMAAGKLVIATALPPFAEAATDGAPIRLVPAGDPEALVAALRTALDHPKERAATGQQGQAYVARARQWQDIAGLVLDRVDAVLRDGTSRPPHRRAQPEGKTRPVDIGLLGWPAAPTHSKVTVMAVTDVFTRSCLAPDLNLIEPRPDNWQSLLNRDDPSLLFVESAWRGNGGSWQYRVAKYNAPPGKEVQAMVDGFRASGRPTVFWNKEDPVHFDDFHASAQRFDHVFTTAQEAVPRYESLGCRSVHVLPFAAQPALHNPIGSGLRNGRVCFAGSYYANRFADRRNEQLALLNAAADFKLDIYDRNAGAVGDFNFPANLAPFVLGKLTYEEMCIAYRQYQVFLNVNSVTNSRSMFSRRVFELLACGTPVITTPSVGITEMFGEDTVLTARNEHEAREALGFLLTCPAEWRRRSLLGIRKIFRAHCFSHRIDTILETVGLAPRLNQPPKVVVLGFGKGPAAEARLRDQLAAQQPGTLDLKLLFLDTGTAGRTVEDSRQLLDQLRKTCASHVVGLQDGAAYAPHCIEDMLHAAVYSKASAITKASTPRDRYTWQPRVAAACWMVSAPAFCRALRLVGPSWMASSAAAAHQIDNAFAGDIFACGGDGFWARSSNL